MGCIRGIREITIFRGERIMSHVTPVPWANRFKQKILYGEGGKSWKFDLILFVVNMHCACHEQRRKNNEN